ncbi:MAG: tetratricopeptide repeat protein [Calditrichaeota bacterium]|nr:tetratricopeptide repeat protein [Calditrichota bacterium]
MNKFHQAVICLLLILIVQVGSSFSASPDLLFEAGNREYLDGNYVEALDRWLQIEKDEYQAAELYYNIGNAYFKLNELGEAIQYWEKASLLLGEDEDLKANLTIARLKLVDKLEEEVRLPVWDWFDQFRSMLSDTMLTTFAIILCFLLFALLSMRKWITKRSKGKSTIAIFAWILLVVLFLDLGFIGLQMKDDSAKREGVMIAKEVEVLSAPAMGTGKLLFSLHEGTKVRVIRSMTGWHEISVGKKKHGWVQSSQVGLI